ncbi:hypothetical protein QP794_04040 [Paenibacillus sp. UMB7766-LJ446]|uniref:hypothetical protein n=1 Tax=Paenibacillus sp. UMB7766-LJ446 TaxID=3046313 RepID=UPI0025504688|nr:hypothetical protein [Paenibacillus sp. UMB7766-LJ446]MDK8189251.1 hypothetical protein [Paenibacillus sp. UMB7766-LJ446]
MRSILILLFCSIITIGCTKPKIDFDELASATAKAEKSMNDKDLVVTTATSSDKKTINIRILVEGRLTNEQAKYVVTEFINEIEKGIQETDLFRKSYLIKFDIMSQKDGEILYKGQRNKGEETIWWQL